MGSKKDPFNFDDIYRQAGVEDLFVKKSLVDMKKTTPNLPAAAPAPVPVARAADTASTTANASPPISQQSTPRAGAAATAPVQAKPRTNLSSDPFATLGLAGRAAQPMATQRPKQQEPAIPAPVPARAPPTATATTAQGATPAAAMDLDDIFGFSGTSAAKKNAAPSTAADPFAAFGDVDGALPAYSSPAQPDSARSSNAALVDLDDTFGNLPPPPKVPPPTASVDAETDFYVEPPGPSPPPAFEPPAPVAAPRPAPPPPVPTSADALIARPSPPLRPPQPPVQAYPPTAQPQQQAASQDARPISKFFQQYGEQPHAEPARAPPAEPPSHSSSGGEEVVGFKGLFKMGASLGKKAFKAVKAGLESVIDSRQPDASPSDERQPPQEVSADEVLAHAIHISEMPSYKQEDALVRLPRPLRLRVIQVLREQALLEAEPSQEEAGPGGHHAMEEASSPLREDAYITTSEFDVGAHEPQQAAASAYNPPSASYSQEQAGNLSKSASASVLSEPQPPAAAPPPAVAHEEDLLGMGAPGAAQPAVPAEQTDLLSMGGPAAAPAASAAPHEDLLGFGNGPSQAPAPAAAAVVRDVSEVDDFFAGGSPAPSPSPPHPHVARQLSSHKSSSAPNLHEDSLDDFFGGGAKAGAKATPPATSTVQKSSSMLDLGLGTSAPAGSTDEGSADEPELRKRLRAQRLAEQDARMAAALAEKKAKEEAETARRAEQVDLKDKLQDTVNAWKNKNKGNIRGMLGSLHTVLWENSGWQVISVGDLLEASQVRKAYMKANLIVHPDKVRQKNGTAEMIAIADMVFDTLKEAWGQFQK